MNDYNSRLVGERIKELLTETGLGQNALAKQLNLSNAGISYWETGKQEPGAAALFKLSQFFNVSANCILGLED